MDRYFNSERIGLFYKRIETILNDMVKFKNEHPNSWKDEYNTLSDELKEVLSIIEDNPIEANNIFQNNPISKYDTFRSYVYNNDINSITTIKGNNERSKILRAARTYVNCPSCGKSLTLSEGTSICEACGYIGDAKSTVPNTRASSNNTKHTYKQLDALTGVRKAPANITKIIDYISLWLTDLHYIYAWLRSNGGKKYDVWIKKYATLTDEYITQSFFDRIIERKPENMWDYNLFKLFTDELYAMLEHATRYSNLNTSNMEGMSDEEIIAVFTSFVKEFHRLPSVTEEYIHKNKRYEIGLYINNLSLLHTVPKDHIKIKLESTIGMSLTMPGLMFNYKEIYKKSENPPKKYCYQQEYCWITNRTFNTPFIDISKPDKEAIATLIIKFNEYYKEKTYNNNDKNCNSPLYCCTIACVLNLPYFQKYKEALKFIPIKDMNTVSHIRKEFFNFEINNPDLIKPYQKVVAETESNKIITEVIKKEQLPEEINFTDDILF